MNRRKNNNIDNNNLSDNNNKCSIVIKVNVHNVTVLDVVHSSVLWAPITSVFLFTSVSDITVDVIDPVRTRCV